MSNNQPIGVCFHGLGQMTRALDARLCSDLLRHYCSARDLVRAPFSSVDQHWVHVAGVNASGMDWLVDSLRSFEPSDCWIVTKGLRFHEEQLMTFVAWLRLMLPDWSFGMIAGPALASDVLRPEIPIALLLAADQDLSHSFFDQSALSLAISQDVEGVCYLAALKNIYAIVLGHASRLSLSTMAMVYTRALHELLLWMDMVGGSRESVASVAGVGDLMVTALGGRNARFGQELHHLAPSQILAGPMMGVTVEAYALMQVFEASGLWDRWRLRCPDSILLPLQECVTRDLPIRQAWYAISG